MPKQQKTKKKTVTLSFRPRQVTKRLLEVLPERAADVITRRYGLGTDVESETLESIGQRYGITRERVRQIENYSIATIQKSDAYEKDAAVFSELEAAVYELGGIIPEQLFLDLISTDPSTQNHVHFLLVLGQPFVRNKENDHFHHRWHVDESLAAEVEQALRRLYESLSDEDLVQEGEIVNSFLGHLKNVSEEYRDEEILRRWLRLSKRIDVNPLGEWGRAESPNIRLRGLRDYAYLVIRQHGSPMHFSEVANRISELFGKNAHVATAHNELIKDKRFVLVGRGLYALSEWGYAPGVVKDVIEGILKQSGPLSKDQIIEKVLKERYVKPNTVLVNLQDKRFKKTREGKYSLV